MMVSDRGGVIGEALTFEKLLLIFSYEPLLVQFSCEVEET